MRKVLIVALICATGWSSIIAENGYRLWLRYDRIREDAILESYRSKIEAIMVARSSTTLDIAANELKNGLEGLLDKQMPYTDIPVDHMVVAGVPSTSELIRSLDLEEQFESMNKEGFIVRSVTLAGKNIIVIAAANDIGVLYGVFHFLRILQTNGDISNLRTAEEPALDLRILNHWDNLDRTVERGYAGFSLWDWHKLPDFISPRYTDYARANASIGINGTVLTNVNANSLILTPQYLAKAAALASVFRPYGIKVYLTARFSAPIEIGKLKTADPLDESVVEWWNEKVKEIYNYIPDFGGFLVKANSEGQPGPQNYGRSHADGANLLADALKPFGGVVMWRAFVYDNNIPEDRAKQAYNEFVPLDGTFRDNVVIQVKNGPVDFQPREPFHPLFGAMKETALMPEFQITQEYLGFATHFVFLGTLFKETLESDTWCRGQGSTVKKVIDGSLTGQKITGMAGVTNIGDEINWTGHPLGQSNWYALGRLAWNPDFKAEQIADEWIRMTFSQDKELIQTISAMMLASREIIVNYMTPLGLHHLMGKDHHYGPAPWVNEGRADWTSVYYHKAELNGIGFNRSSTGSNATGQYFKQIADLYDNPETCPDELLLWFHHLGWDYKMKSGRTLWNEICFRYARGVDSVLWLKNEWQMANGLVDNERFNHVNDLLTVQLKESRWWRDACILYFQQFSQRPIPEGIERAEHDLEHYMNLKFYFVPGI
jgi:alpha-glucuronidase